MSYLDAPPYIGRLHNTHCPRYRSIMMSPKQFVFITFILILTSSCTSTKSKPLFNNAPPPPVTVLETDTLQAKPGHTGKLLGASVETSKSDPGSDQQIIEINVPVNPDQVDEVQVISESGETIKQKRAAEIIRNYESDNVGITIFLSKEKNMSFKLRLIDNIEEN